MLLMLLLRTEDSYRIKRVLHWMQTLFTKEKKKQNFWQWQSNIPVFSWEWQRQKQESNIKRVHLLVTHLTKSNSWQGKRKWQWQYGKIFCYKATTKITKIVLGYNITCAPLVNLHILFKILRSLQKIKWSDLYCCFKMLKENLLLCKEWALSS